MWQIIYILPIMQYCLLTNISIIGFLDPESIWLETIIVLIGKISSSYSQNPDLSN